MAASGALTLTKHHGAGNDFLVLLDPDDARPLGADEVAALCDRHRGVGADGVIRVTGRGALSMDLRNADGSVAEMSGNGIRCLVQAAVDGGLAEPGTVTVHTLAGVRAVDYRAEGPGAGHARVGMGPARLGPEVEVPDLAGAAWARRVDMGNPHVVVFGAVVDDDATVAEVGARLGRAHEGGANVEFVWPGRPGELVLRVFERGVGETLACGTGACAALAAARAHGAAGDAAAVRSPGGTLEVECRGDELVLAGPTVRVAEVVVDGAWLAAARRGAPGGAAPAVEVAARR